MAAVHETVTDRIMFTPNKNLGPELAQKIKDLEDRLGDVSLATSQNRRSFRTQIQSLNSENTKAFNWSEVRPEWGLAGNHSFIVAPRWRTKQQSFNGGVFLHDYDAQADDGFQPLN